MVSESWRPGVDGIVTRLDHTLDELITRGHEVLMVAPTQGEPTPHLVQRRSPSVVVPLIDNARPWGVPHPRLRRVVTDFSPDVVHLVNPVLMGAAAARQLGGRFPLVASLHTDVAAYTSGYGLQWLRPVLHRLTSRAFSRADAALATSATGVRLLNELGIADVGVWPPGVDAVFLAANPSTTHEAPVDHLNSPPMRILAVGRLAREKGCHVLEPVMRLDAQTHHQLSVTFVGDGPDRPRLTKLFAGTDATFTGVRRPQQLAELYRHADVLAFTSTTDTVGLVLLEAAAADLPIVAVDTTATRDTLSGYGRVVLVPIDAPPTTWLRAFDAARRSVPTEPTPESSIRWARGWDDATDVLLATYQRLLKTWTPATVRWAA